MILCILILGLGLASLLINKRPLHILTAVLLPLPALVSFLLLVFSTSYRAQILWGLGVFLILLWYPAVFLRKHGKVVLRIACLATALCLLSSGALYGMERYRESITLREAQDLLDRYTPYGEDSLVARLDAPPTLRLEEPLPRMDGATALYPIYSAFARALYPEEQIEGHLLCSTTTGAWDAIVRGDSDIIFTAAPSREQLQEAEDRGVTLNFTPIGKEAFVFFVNAKNPIESLTLAQVRSIYAGKTTHWRDLDVPSLGRIRAFQREPGSGSQSALIRLMGGIVHAVSDYQNHPGAIGYSFRFYLTQMLARGDIKPLSLEGIASTRENIENGAYPVSDAFYAVTRADADENTRALLAWIISPQGQELIEKTGYTGIA
ncbi:MAG: PstS family phosphate ABC transporter substrate-binding protein [Candidatus Excrementavichristensenella sp.]|jgi:phosphate transport system substrate-binding protein